jgi:hypothetical protein
MIGPDILDLEGNLMGLEVMATCDCGVNTFIMVGGGMRDFTTTCYFPCLCEACQGLVQFNLLDQDKRCPQCQGKRIIPYDDPGLLGTPGLKIVAEWRMQDQLGRDLQLTDGQYKCPRCNKYTLRFEESGCFD